MKGLTGEPWVPPCSNRCSSTELRGPRGRRVAPACGTHSSARAQCPMEPHRLRHALERHVADELELDLVDAGAPFGLLAHEYLVRSRVVGDPGCDVDGSAEVVALLGDHRPRIDAYPRGNGDLAFGLLDQVQSAEDGTTGVAEMEHHAVPEPFHRPTAMRLSGLLHEAREVRRKLGRGLVALLLRERRVTGEIQERNRGRPPRLRGHEPSLLHELLGHADQVLEDGALTVTPLEPRDDAADELREAGRTLVHEPVTLLVRDCEGRDPLANGAVEELQPRDDQSLHGAAVEPREA